MYDDQDRPPWLRDLRTARPEAEPELETAAPVVVEPVAEPGTVEVARVVVLSTAHKEFSEPNFVAWRKAGVEVILDGRNFWNQDEVETAGMLYFGIGRSSRVEQL